MIKEKMKKIILSIALCFLCINCSNTTAPNENNNNTAWVFVANEGEYDFSGQTNTGTISMIDSHGNVYETENLGDIIHSLVVYDDKLITSVNNSQKILIFETISSSCFKLFFFTKFEKSESIPPLNTIRSSAFLTRSSIKQCGISSSLTSR